VFQVNKSEKPSFHVAFELLFLYGALQLFVRPDVTSDFLQVSGWFLLVCLTTDTVLMQHV